MDTFKNESGLRAYLRELSEDQMLDIASYQVWQFDRHGLLAVTEPGEEVPTGMKRRGSVKDYFGPGLVTGLIQALAVLCLIVAAIVAIVGVQALLAALGV